MRSQSGKPPAAQSRKFSSGWLVACLVAAAGVAAYLLAPRPTFQVVTVDGKRIGGETPRRQVTWQPAQRVLARPANLGPRDSLIAPQLVGGGSILYFTLRRHGGQYDIYRSELVEGQWQEAELAEGLNSEADDIGPVFRNDGSQVYFQSNRPGGFGGYDIYLSESTDQGWSEPKNLGPGINTPANDFDPAISPDGHALYFTSDRSPKLQQWIEQGRLISPGDPWTATLRANPPRLNYDIFVAHLQESGQWSLPRSVASINRPNSHEGAPFVSQNGSFLYFASDRVQSDQTQPNYDIYRARIRRQQLSNIENLGPGINTPQNETEPSLSPEGFRLYFSRSLTQEEFFSPLSQIGESNAARPELSPQENSPQENSPQENSPQARPPAASQRQHAQGKGDQRDVAQLEVIDSEIYALYTSQAVEVEDQLSWDTSNWDTLAALVLEYWWPLVLLLLMLALLAGLVALLRQPTWRRLLVPTPLMIALLLHIFAGAGSFFVYFGDEIASGFRQFSEYLSPGEISLEPSRENGAADFERLAELRPIEATQTPTVTQQTTQVASLSMATPRFRPTLLARLAETLPTDRVIRVQVNQPTVTSPAAGPTALARRPTRLLAEAAPQITLLKPKALSKPSEPSLDPTQITLARNEQRPQINSTPSADLAGPTLLDRSVTSPGPLPSEEVPPERLTPQQTLWQVVPKIELASQRGPNRMESTEEPPVLLNRLTLPAGQRKPKEDGIAQPVAVEVARLKAEQGNTQGFPEQVTAFRLPVAVASSPEVDQEDHQPPQPSAATTRLTRAELSRTLPRSSSQSPQALTGDAVPTVSLAQPPRQRQPAEGRIGLAQTRVPRVQNRLLALPARLLEQREHSGNDQLRTSQEDPAVPQEPTARKELDVGVHLAGPLLPSTSLVNSRTQAASVRDEVDVVDLHQMFEIRQAGPVRDVVLKEFGGSDETEAAVDRGLAWLAEHQFEDGHWGLHDFHACCQKHRRCRGAGSCRSDTAGTGFGLMPFLGAGHTHQAGKYQKVVAGGLRWLVNHQKKNGDLFSGGTHNSHMYSHGIAAIALCEAYGMTKDPSLRGPAERALDFIVQAQHSASGGWRYQPNQHADTSVVGWQVMALKSGQMAGLDVPEATWAGVRRWIDSVEGRGRKIGQFGYQNRADGRPAMTAEALLCKQYLGSSPSEKSLQQGAEFLVGKLPRQGKETSYYWYYGTQVLFHLQGEHWERWNEATKRLLLETQIQQGPQAGTWEPQDNWERQGGRIYATSLRLLMLEVYYRHLPLYRRLQVQEPVTAQ